jgi:hypothetical protein
LLQLKRAIARSRVTPKYSHGAMQPFIGSAHPGQNLLESQLLFRHIKILKK